MHYTIISYNYIIILCILHDICVKYISFTIHVFQLSESSIAEREIAFSVQKPSFLSQPKVFFSTSWQVAIMIMGDADSATYLVPLFEY